MLGDSAVSSISPALWASAPRLILLRRVAQRTLVSEENVFWSLSTRCSMGSLVALPIVSRKSLLRLRALKFSEAPPFLKGPAAKKSPSEADMCFVSTCAPSCSRYIHLLGVYEIASVSISSYGHALHESTCLHIPRSISYCSARSPADVDAQTINQPAYIYKSVPGPYHGHGNDQRTLAVGRAGGHGGVEDSFLVGLHRVKIVRDGDEADFVACCCRTAAGK